ncbi:hypothetical protein OAP18_01005 [Gammaproteobacteria bacterium]|nr:hypothetical protein [Gammaproteobacteria bacterium]
MSKSSKLISDERLSRLFQTESLQASTETDDEQFVSTIMHKINTENTKYNLVLLLAIGISAVILSFQIMPLFNYLYSLFPLLPTQFSLSVLDPYLYPSMVILLAVLAAHLADSLSHEE